MDSGTRLDYALFQLTPTRTRCDLVIFSGGKTEKLAYGLFQPFVSHLKFAKDEISKGGYSITLRPPTTGDSSWFTKATFERFVRFVSTPEILERFINLEKEILQTESSIQSNELEQANQAREGEQVADVSSVKSPDSSKLQGETLENDDLVQEENSRIRLQRLLQTRKAMLLRSQAMAFARGRAAGFDMDNMDELIAFSDAFGASRLREACMEFKELCKKKQSDGPWMEELSAMEAFSSSELSFPATSGIILANELNYSNGIHLSLSGSSDGSKHETATDAGSDGRKDDNVAASDQIPANKIQMQVPWPNQFPPYMYPIHQMPPYQGFPFPVMQSAPPYQGYHDPNWEKKYKTKSSSGKKDRNSHHEEEEEDDNDSEEDTQTESSDGGRDPNEVVEKEKRHSSLDSTYRKKHKKKSSRTVVIRNINYITSKGKDGEDDGDSDDSSSEGEFIDGDSLKKKVEGAVEALKKNHKSKKHSHKKNTIAATEQGSVDNDSNNGDDDSSIVRSSNENWDAFKNILMRNEESDSKMESRNEYSAGDERFTSRNFQDEVSGYGNVKVATQRKVTDDSMIVTERHGEGNLNASSLDFDNRETARMVLKRSGYADDALLLSGSFDGSGNARNNSPLDGGADSSLIRNRRSEDSFFVHGKSENGDPNTKQIIFDGDPILSSGNSRKDAPIDDSFMIPALVQNDDRSDSQWKSDISMVNEYMQENVTAIDVSQEDKLRSSKSYEPDDLCVVLGREDDVESNRLSWNADYAIDISMTEVGKSSGKEMAEKDSSNDKGPSSDGKLKDVVKQVKPKGLTRSVVKSKPEVTSRVRKPTPPVSRTAVQKNKFEKEEEMRKRMEEMVIERQKRIAERTAASGPSIPVKKSPVKTDKTKSPSTGREVNRINSQNRAVRV